KFLFYRGIGNFDLMLRLQAKGNDRFVVRNLSSEPVHSLILLERTNEGKMRFAVHELLDGKQQQELQLPETDMSQNDLEKEIEVALVSAGLFRKEALAMIATWRSSWFGETGTRMFYLLPEMQTERLLPLSIQPVPEESVRVMVGRLEIMTPDREQKLEGLLKAQANLQPEQIDPKSELGVELAALGRFAEPALSRIVSSSKEPEVKRVAEKLIERLVNGPEDLWKANAIAIPSLPLVEDEKVKTEAREEDSGEVEAAPNSN
ncbi:MAG TPA: hypothetical protein VMM56_07430, partial [Planctomycetaceae bacterium]|nr:hypothetical protein [Planctomycetaceae bacterium]